MKILILILCSFSMTATAVTLTKFHSSAQGSATQKFVLKPTGSEYLKQSNLFDEKTDHRLGTFKVINPESIKDKITKLNEILDKIKLVDQALKAQGGSFNDLSGEAGHDVVLIIDEYRIGPKSDLYPELSKLFTELKNVSWVLREGIVFNEELENFKVIKNGKESGKISLNRESQCLTTSHRICHFKEGILHLKIK